MIIKMMIGYHDIIAPRHRLGCQMARKSRAGARGSPGLDLGT